MWFISLMGFDRYVKISIFLSFNKKNINNNKIQTIWNIMPGNTDDLNWRFIPPKNIIINPI